MQGGAGPKAWGFLQPHDFWHHPSTVDQPLQPRGALAVTSSRSSGKVITARPNMPLLVQKLDSKQSAAIPRGVLAGGWGTAGRRFFLPRFSPHSDVLKLDTKA